MARTSTSSGGSFEAGWRVRYEPAVEVGHREPVALTDRLRRRFDYGTSAAPLARRHPGRLVHLVVSPAPAVTVAAFWLVGRGWRRIVRGRHCPPGRSLPAGSADLAGRRRHVGDRRRADLARCRAVRRPVRVAGARRPARFAPGGRTARVRHGRRLAVLSLVLGPVLAGWRQARRRAGISDSRPGPLPSPLRYGAELLADQAVYGAGVYAGCCASARSSRSCRHCPAVTSADVAAGIDLQGHERDVVDPVGMEGADDPFAERGRRVVAGRRRGGQPGHALVAAEAALVDHAVGVEEEHLPGTEAAAPLRAGGAAVDAERRDGGEREEPRPSSSTRSGG